MKCNIVQDLLPLYAEGLCAEETARELEQHFAECKECAALKNGRFFSADMSTISTINQGMSAEKLEQIYDILQASV